MLVNENDFNENGELLTSMEIRKKHFEDYFKNKVILVNSEEIRNIEDIKNLIS